MCAVTLKCSSYLIQLFFQIFPFPLRNHTNPLVACKTMMNQKSANKYIHHISQALLLLLFILQPAAAVEQKKKHDEVFPISNIYFLFNQQEKKINLLYFVRQPTTHSWFTECETRRMNCDSTFPPPTTKNKKKITTIRAKRHKCKDIHRCFAFANVRTRLCARESTIFFTVWKCTCKYINRLCWFTHRAHITGLCNV